MQFIYGDFAGEEKVNLSIKEYPHIFKVRRVALKQKLYWRNLRDEYLYTYELTSIDKKEAILNLLGKKELKETHISKLHIAWCMVDPKTIEKNIAMLNEMGVKKISFVYADFSQKNYKIDEQRLKRILINSSEQCGRSSLMEYEVLQSVQEYLRDYPKSAIIDFCENYLSEKSESNSFLVGPEGGFSDNERKEFKDREVYGLKASNILRSETAVIGICAKLSL